MGVPAKGGNSQGVSGMGAAAGAGISRGGKGAGTNATLCMVDEDCPGADEPARGARTAASPLFARTESAPCGPVCKASGCGCFGRRNWTPKAGPALVSARDHQPKLAPPASGATKDVRSKFT
jgi:hypothetical protein